MVVWIQFVYFPICVEMDCDISANYFCQQKTDYCCTTLCTCNQTNKPLTIFTVSTHSNMQGIHRSLYKTLFNIWSFAVSSKTEVYLKCEAVLKILNKNTIFTVMDYSAQPLKQCVKQDLYLCVSSGSTWLMKGRRMMGYSVTTITE